MTRLLLVDVTIYGLRALLETYLQREGFQSCWRPNWRQKERALRETPVDLMSWT